MLDAFQMERAAVAMETKEGRRVVIEFSCLRPESLPTILSIDGSSQFGSSALSTVFRLPDCQRLAPR
jgi:hypothetical protein